jgi:hypothetical protein
MRGQMQRQIPDAEDAEVTQKTQKKTETKTERKPRNGSFADELAI